MKRTLAFPLLAGLVALSAASASASPTTDLVRSMRAFNALKSYHADVKMSQGTIGIDFVAPDKRHETLPSGAQMITIGSSGWMYLQGRWMKLPMTMPNVQQMSEQAGNAGFNGSASEYHVVYLGPATIGTTSTRHYRGQKAGESPVEWWIASNGLPVQAVVQTNGGAVTIRYSQFNAVSDITPPM